ncbi:MAG: hypothetical protein HW419_4452, partial [Deltaproteobacteria bacterium]|nr:hypothetical protein [Deltaproteobacteria bacterium]
MIASKLVIMMLLVIFPLLGSCSKEPQSEPAKPSEPAAPPAP